MKGKLKNVEKSEKSNLKRNDLKNFRVELVKPEDWSYNKEIIAAIIAEYFYQKRKSKI